jgi:hypothetical protein
MLILLTILVLAAAVSAFIYYFNKNISERQLDASDVGMLPETTHLRGLFEPSDEDLLVESQAAEYQAELDDERYDDEVQRSRQAELRSRLRAWQNAPNIAEIGELLELARTDGDSSAAAVETITKEFLNGRIDRISSDDLAQMLESHSWLIPADERGPAVSFRIKEAIRELRETVAKAPTV